MRIIIILAVLIVASWAIDTSAFDGRYLRAAWQEANYQGQKVNYEVRYWIKKSGL